MPQREPLHLTVNRIKRVIFGAPKRTDQAHNERLSVFAGLAVFSSDALSSVAYATEEILLVLAVGGAAASVYSIPIGLAIVALIFIVSASYNQTIHAYPSGGGSYIVSKDNLGTGASLVAGAALLIDYVLTVAVSTASGIAAMTSAIKVLHGHEVLLCLIAIWFIAWVNLRGVKESGGVFAIPTYGFILSMFTLIIFGLYRAVSGHWTPIAPIEAGFGLGGVKPALIGPITTFTLLRAFASGCTALTGIEAVSNGVQAFKPPEDKHAIRTMKYGRNILFLLFAGLTLLVYGFGLMPGAHGGGGHGGGGGETLLSQLAREVFGGGPLYYVIQAATTLILLLAANTAYADFPRLAGMIANDGYLPRRLANRGDTLVYNGGVYLLAFTASTLIVVFRGSVHHLIPLYAVGVFLAFTMSQTGMVMRWLRIAKEPGESLGRHTWSIFINGLGAFLSGVALTVVAITKFTHGAWIVCIIIPAVVIYFRYVHNYYELFRTRVADLGRAHMKLDDAKQVKVVLTIGGLTNVIDHSIRVARQISNDITAVFVATDPEVGEKVARKWDANRHKGVPLKVLDSPYRSLVPPLRKYLTELHNANPHTVINLLVPAIVTNDPFDSYLHNGAADQLVRELRFSEGILITVIPFFVDMDPHNERVIANYPVTTD